MQRFLLRHLGNLGDMTFFVPPVLESLKKHYPGCHITVVTSWGFKEKKRWLASRSLGEGWGKRNQGGHSLHLLMTNPHIDELAHWHDTTLSLAGDICHEDGQSFLTWSRDYYEEQKQSGKFDGVFELDFGLKIEDNPINRVYESVGLPDETFGNYRLYLTEQDRAVARAAIDAAPRPRIVLLEGLGGIPMRHWDPGKIPALEAAIKKVYGVAPIWFGARFAPYYQGRPLTLRENIATLTFCDIAIGVLSGPIHFAAAVGLPTLTLYGDHPLHRAAPAYFLNPYISDERRWHRTLLSPTGPVMKIFKPETPDSNLTPAEVKRQNFKNWMLPGRQASKSSLAVITVAEIMLVLQDMMR